MLTLKQLRYFVEISRAGSFTAAAHVLCVAQPALSYQIGQLEGHLGTTLFVRSPSGVKLTAAGELLLEHVQPILRALLDATNAVRDRGVAAKGAVSIGFISSVAPFLAPLTVSECQLRCPEVVVTVVEGDNASILQQIRGGMLDYAITLPGNNPGSELPLVIENLFLYSRCGGPASGRDTVSFEEALRHKLVLPPRNHMLRDLIEGIARERNLSPTVEAEAGHATSKSLVLAGVGCGIANFAAFKLELEAGVIAAAELVDPPVQRTLVLAARREERFDDAAVEVRRILLGAVGGMQKTLKWRLCEDLH